MEPSEEHVFDWGNNLLQLHAYEEAAQVFTAGIERHPKSARMHVGIGIAQYSRGQYEDAATVVLPGRGSGAVGSAPLSVPRRDVRRRARRSAPRSPAAGRVREGASARRAGAVLLRDEPVERSGRPRRRPRKCAVSRRCSGEAITLDRKLAKAFLQLGILLSEDRRYTEAIPELQRAAELEPDLAQAHYRLAQAYQRTGQEALAAKELEIFERLNSKSKTGDGHPTTARHEGTKARRILHALINFVSSCLRGLLVAVKTVRAYFSANTQIAPPSGTSG